jgi:hypothetical protein
MSRYHEITLTVGGVAHTLWRPNDFQPVREDVYSAEYTTCTGKLIADRIGWRYAEMTMQWDSLPQSQLDVLLSMSGECQLTFTDADGSHTESVIRSGNSITATRHTAPDGHPLWMDVQCSITFITTHAS